MGLTKRPMEKDDGNAFLVGLTTSGHIEDRRALGVLRHVIDRGIESRSVKQIWVWNQFVQPLLNRVATCEGGCGAISVHEKLNAPDNGGFCAYCEHKMDKDD